MTTPWMHPAATPAVRWAMRLRLRLMPLLYTLYVQAVEAGEPVLRPTFFDFDADPETWAFSDEVGAQAWYSVMRQVARCGQCNECVILHC